MRFPIAAISLSLLAASAAAQTTTFVVTADLQGSGPVYQTPGGAWRLEFLPAGPQTVTVPSDRFVYLNFGTLRVTGAVSSAPEIGVTFLIAQQGTSQIGRYTGQILRSPHFDPRQSTRIRFNNLAPASLDGVHYSTVDNELSLLPPSEGAAVFDIPVRAQLTRGGFVWNQDQVTVDLDNSANSQKRFPITLPAGTSPATTQIFDSVFTTGTATEGALWFGTGFPGADFTATFQAPGVPPRTIPVLVRVVTPSVGFFTTPDELTFRYQKGDPSPPTQFLTLRTTGTGLGSFAITASLYDGNWITVNPIPALAPGAAVPVPVVPNMTNKNTGFHNTTIVFRWGNLTRDVRVNFEVYDLPGSLNVTSSGLGAVTISPALPAYPNGTLVRLTATPDRYHRFAGWTGSIPSLRNPLEFLVNGPMSFEAQFPFAGQDVSCVPKLSPSFLAAPPEGDAGRIDLQIDRTCPWTVANLPSWMRVNTTSTFTDTAQFVSYSIDPNPGTAARTATIQVAGVPVLVEQAPPACAAIRAFSPPILPFTSSAFFSFLRTLPEGCPDAPRASGSWLTTNSFQANPSPTPRTAMIYAGGSRVPVIQRGLWMPTPYADVPFSHDAAPYVGLLKSLDIADTCGANQFCPDAAISRADTARYLVLAVLRTSAFAGSQTPLFSDVPPSHAQFRWIQKLAELGLTQGCGGGRYCPDQLLTRAQLAAFLARANARVGPGAHLYPPAIPYFHDVPATSPFFAPVQKMRQWGVSLGCTDTGFCPNVPATRAQLATMLVRALFTPSE